MKIIFWYNLDFPDNLAAVAVDSCLSENLSTDDDEVEEGGTDQNSDDADDDTEGLVEVCHCSSSDKLDGQDYLNHAISHSPSWNTKTVKRWRLDEMIHNRRIFSGGISFPSTSKATWTA